jgi:hypothetical protein
MIDNIIYQRCIYGLWDTTIQDISFDNQGISNYFKMFKKLEEEFPRGEIGRMKWEAIIEKIRQEGRGNKYDCIIGVSGGTDSSYLLHLAVKEWGLRPLAVNLDNGWSSDIAVTNIKIMTDELKIDLETFVIQYEEVKAVLRAFMKAGLPWVDGPTDLAITSILYQIAVKENIKTILVGVDFRSEGKQPNDWTYTDGKLFNHIVQNFEGIELKTFPRMSLYQQIFYGMVLRIRKYQPFYHIDYKKLKAQKFLSNNYGWKYYGGHHYENLFTRFVISYWLVKKFNIDKRIITLSAQLVSGEKSRDEALKELKKAPYDVEQMERDKNTVIKKLGLSKKEFEIIWNNTNKTFHDYPSHYNFLMNNRKLINHYSHFVMPSKPKIFIVGE